MQTFLTHAALFVVSLIYAITYNIIKFVTPVHIPPLALTGFRIVGAAVLFAVFHRLFVREPITRREDWGRLLLCAFFGVVFNQICFVKGVSITTPINASVIMINTPVMVLLASAVLLGERLTRLKVLGVGLGAIGVFWLIGGMDFRLRAETVLGDLLILTNAASYGIYLVIVKPLLVRYRTVTVIQWVFLIGTVAIIPISWQGVQTIAWEGIPLFVWGSIAFIILGTTFLTYLLNGWALRRADSSLVGFYVYLQPILTTLIAIWLNTDTLTPGKVGAILLIFAGVYLVSRKAVK